MSFTITNEFSKFVEGVKLDPFSFDGLWSILPVYVYVIPFILSVANDWPIHSVSTSYINLLAECLTLLAIVILNQGYDGVDQ